jgi:hypothetical protein
MKAMLVMNTALFLGLSLSLCAQDVTRGLAGKKQPLAPRYSINFTEGEAVAGVGAIPVIRLPFECSEDGTVFLSTLQTLNGGSPPANLAPHALSMLLISVSPNNEAHSFPLNNVPNLYDIRQVDDYPSISTVVFLLEAASEEKKEKRTDLGDDGQQIDAMVNVAPRHAFLVLFGRDGKYSRTVQVDDSFEISHIGLFPTGTYLAYGYDRIDHSPKLALLKEDGTLLKYLESPKGAMPDSAVRQEENSAAFVVSPTQFIGHAHSIYVLQNRTDLPILEVDESGGVRAIKPMLRSGLKIDMLIASDLNLYGRMSNANDGSIFEFDENSGNVLKRFDAKKDQSGAGIACVHDNKFVSFRQTEGKLVPLSGSAAPASIDGSDDTNVGVSSH